MLYNLLVMKKFRIKTRYKLTGGGEIILALTSLSLIGLGFSSYTISNEPVKLEALNVEITDIVDYSKYLIFNKNEATIDSANSYMPPLPFEYNSEGVIDNGLVGLKGSFTFYLGCKLKGEEGIYPLDTSLTEFNIRISLYDRGSFKILDYLSTSVNYQIKSGSYLVANSSNVSDENISSFALSCTNIDLLNCENIFYTITMSFDFTNTDYVNNIYPNLKNSSIYMVAEVIN